MKVFSHATPPGWNNDRSITSPGPEEIAIAEEWIYYIQGWARLSGTYLPRYGKKTPGSALPAKTDMATQTSPPPEVPTRVSAGTQSSDQFTTHAGTQTSAPLTTATLEDRRASSSQPTPPSSSNTPPMAATRRKRHEVLHQ
ncbi:hypothetical protein EV426DRAFT_718831 [Tirmania nivea]|nr:hypothetical protein EV426DRAFT_718831 [Tirmania nivea]